MEKIMKGMKICLAVLTGLSLLACERVLDPMPNGHYTDENLSDYPTKLRGFVDKAYSLSNTTTYNTNEYIYLDCATDDGVLTSPTAVLRKLAQGSISPSEDPCSIFRNIQFPEGEFFPPNAAPSACGCTPWGGVGGQVSDIEIQANEILKDRQTLNEILSECSGKSVEQIAKDVDRDFYLSAAEAKEYGLVDNILFKAPSTEGELV